MSESDRTPERAWLAVNERGMVWFLPPLGDDADIQIVSPAGGTEAAEEWIERYGWRPLRDWNRVTMLDGSVCDELLVEGK